MTQRQDQVANLLRELSASFLQGESTNISLITVTYTTVSKDLKRATIYMTVMPEDKEQEALEFVKRKLKDLREHIKQRTNLKFIPFFDVEIDKGEKNRQLIDRLMKED